MIFYVKGKAKVNLRELQLVDIERLESYLQNLGPETKSRFGPHGFDRESLLQLFEASNQFIGFIVEENASGEILAYFVIRKGFLEHDSSRLESYGLHLSTGTDCTFAPSVADKWQSKGLGDALFHFVLNKLKLRSFKRIILWGGVQATNEKALNFYNKNGFVRLGGFEYNGWNYDMVKEIE